MDTFVIIQALNVATITLIGSALVVFWRISDRTPFLLHWSIYEFTLAGAVAMHGFQLGVSVLLGIGVPVLLFGIYGYRRQRPPRRSIFVLMFLAIALPAFVLTETLGKTIGIVYLAGAISVGYLAAAAFFVKDGGSLNNFIAGIFVLRIANTLSFAFWDAAGLGHVSFSIGQLLTIAAGLGMLMAGFDKTYRRMKEREEDLVEAQKRSQELMLTLQCRNKEYLKARQTAETANAAKTQFLANMSHELRTPLNAILGFSEALQLLPGKNVREKAIVYSRNIHAAASGLQAIINDILNLSRIEAGALELEPEVCDLEKILEETCRMLQPLADEKNIGLVFEGQQPCIAYCDRRLTRQALINGVSNAIKYTPRGGRVTCSCAVEGSHAVARVQDNGIGIDELSPNRAFEPFWQAGNAFVAENVGVGLGLSIAKSYVEAQKGRIELKPAPQGGAIFRISLPQPALGDVRKPATA